MTAHKEELKAHGSLQDKIRGGGHVHWSAYAQHPGKWGVATHCLFNSKACGYSNQPGQRHGNGRFVAVWSPIHSCEPALALLKWGWTCWMNSITV